MEISSDDKNTHIGTSSQKTFQKSSESSSYIPHSLGFCFFSQVGPLKTTSPAPVSLIANHAALVWVSETALSRRGASKKNFINEIPVGKLFKKKVASWKLSHITSRYFWVEDFPFPKVGGVSSLEGYCFQFIMYIQVKHQNLWNVTVFVFGGQLLGKECQRSMQVTCFHMLQALPFGRNCMTSLSCRASFLSGQRNSTSCNPVPAFWGYKTLVLHELIQLISIWSFWHTPF